MQGIPPAKDSDAEDVVWGLQTAETLWKRGERIDAIVWLRRAAQAAGEAGDDDRALELARAGAEISDWMATQLSAPPVTQAPPEGPHFPPPPPPVLFAPTPPTPPVLPAPPAPPSSSVEVDVEEPEAEAPRLRSFMPPEEPRERPRPPMSRPPSSPTMQTAEPTFEAHDDQRTPLPLEAREQQQNQDEHQPRTTSVPPADKVHAGMFNPWEENALPPPPLPQVPPAPLAARFSSEEEVITSVRPEQLAQQRADAMAAAFAGGVPQSVPPPAPSSVQVAWAEETPVPQPAPIVARPAPPRAPPPRPPPLPPRAMKPRPAPAPDAPVVAPAPAPPAPVPPTRLRVPSEPPPRMTPPPPSPTQVMAVPERGRSVEDERHDEGSPASARAPEPSSSDSEEDSLPSSPPEPPLIPSYPSRPAPEEPAPEAAQVAVARLDLDDVEAFADLPDDARVAFAAAADVSTLGEGEEVSHFALAYILEGTFDVAATMVDAPAARLSGGAVLRSRGTTDEGVPMRLIGVGKGVVATWTDAAVTEAFRTCPWVEEDLRVAADRLQTLVGVTIGPLGERLDASIREQIIGRLTMRTLAPGEVVVTAGEPVPGLLLVGVGELELIAGDTVAGVVGSGEFLFAGEVLGAGAAPHTARAGSGGALILFGDRMIAQELLVTCPPLLEVFAGM